MILKNLIKKELKKKYLGEESNKKVISFICRISEQKRPLLFLQIIASLKKIRKDFKVLVVGDGNLLNKMKEQAQKLKLSNDIIFTGNLKDTTKIYAISDVTVNCSIKEGLALTSYESLSMGVPVVSSDVGGQKELITDNVGKIIKLMQKEEDIYLEQYKNEEIQEYVKAIDEVLNNVDEYKANCRKRIIEGFTINNMIKEMTEIFEKTKDNPNNQKIENGKNLKNNINICKEIFITNTEMDEVEYKWECTNYEKEMYGRSYSLQGYNYKKEILKDKLWNIPMWRTAIKVWHKIRK